MAAQRSRPRSARRRRRVVAATVLLCVGVVAVWRLAGVRPARPRNSTAGVQIDPGAFAAGACVALGPTAGDRGTTVFLDAGHGGIDPGGIGTTGSGRSVDEATVNLAIELDTATLLRARGYRVVVSRTTDTTVLRLAPADLDDGALSVLGSHDDVAARDRCANLAGARVLVGIYMDASAAASSAGSVSIYDADRPFSGQNRRLAQLLQDDVLGAMNGQGWQIPDDGVQSDATYGSYVGDPGGGGLASAAAAYDHLLLLGPAQPGYFADPSAMPGALIEPLYLTDPFEASIAASPTGQEVVARGIAEGVERFLAPAHGAVRS